MVTFPNIPVNVTINEFVDLAKLYSTEKSGGYINGMLDGIARHLIDTGKMAKFMEPKAKKVKAPKAAPVKAVKATGRKRIIRNDNE
jgi:N utilization substance protein B